MKEYIFEHCGQKEFGNTVDITDPCYDHDVWCRINSVPIVPGLYDCTYSNEEGRVSSCCIYHSSLSQMPSDVTYIGNIGVDAGLAGFFTDKPDYNYEEWTEFCSHLSFKDEGWIVRDGFCSSSGWGDGCYDVYGHKANETQYDALQIVFT